MIEDEQTVENTDRNTRNAKTIALHFLAGFGTGVFLAFLVIFYNLFFTFSSLSVQQGAIAIALHYSSGFSVQCKAIAS